MIRNYLTKAVGFTLVDIAKKTTVKKHLNLYNRILEGNKSDVEEYQIEKLRALLSHAYDNVPFYRRRFDSVGFNIDSLLNINDLRKIPPLTRSDIQNNFNDLCAGNINVKSCNKGSSSGSTGEPVYYLHNKIAQSAGSAAHYLGWSLSGWEMGTKGLHIWGNPRVVNVEWKSMSSKLKSYFLRHHKYPAYKLTSENKFDELAQQLIKKKYHFIDGYTNAIYLLAKHVKKNHIQIPRLNHVLTTAENLQDYQRELIEEVMGPVFDGYGCGEINGISYQCKLCREYHNIDPHVVVEYDNSIKGDDGSSSLLITDLDNYPMPLIRYKNGDMGVPGTNYCKIPFSSIKNISGRISDILDIPDGGSLVVPSFFGSMLLKQVKGIKQYQIERIEKNKIRINLVVEDVYSKEDEKTINNSLSEYLQSRINWEIVYLDKIAVSSSGKYKLLVDRTKK